MIKKFSLLLAFAFCLAQVALVGSVTNASACHDSGWSKTVDNCDFGDWHNTCHFGDLHHDNDSNCNVASTQATPSEQSTTTTTTTTTTPTTTTPSGQEDSGYSVVVGDQTHTGAVGTNVVSIVINTVIVSSVAGGLVVFIKKRP